MKIIYELKTCKFCKGKNELTLNHLIGDYCCGLCGEWQNARLDECFFSIVSNNHPDTKDPKNVAVA